MDRLLRAVTALTGLVVAGESMALLVGMHLFARAETWMGLKNDALALFDVALGVVLVVLALKRGDVRSTISPVSRSSLVVLSRLTPIHRCIGWAFGFTLKPAFLIKRTLRGYREALMAIREHASLKSVP